GSVDTQSSVAEESGRVEWRKSWGQGSGGRGQGLGDRGQGGARDGTVFLRGNVLNEARGNGTPDQTNGTRLWRYVAGGDADEWGGHGAVRVFGDREAYRQSFSAIAADRDSETLTRLQRVPVDEFGFSATGARGFGKSVTVGVGLDLRDIRATDAETPVSGGVAGAPTATSAHQRELGGYAEGIWQARGWSVAGSMRVDAFRTFDGKAVTAGVASSGVGSAPSVVAEPEVREVVGSPHLGVVRQLPGGLALTANAFRAFRGPTMNELYRTGQVGQQTTLANPSLVSERATGFEFGGEFADMRIAGREVGHLRASYFWTEVNRPVSTVLLVQTATTQTLQRQNLGQIRSRGLSVEAGTATWRGVDFRAGYQLAVATVTRFDTSSPLQANLAGKWLPEVPRNMATAGVDWARPGWFGVHGVLSYTGRTFDDSANQSLLSGYARLDVSAERTLWRGLGLYAGAQNVLDRRIEAGRTPVLTLAAPRLVQGGLRWGFGD
ncbi:MAG TPA: TonB-dependent receptor, partial [Acidobacteriaceae bacterium]|nr:TonB-dependent receptor [Acidobacteriaceae bacterium]